MPHLNDLASRLHPDSTVARQTEVLLGNGPNTPRPTAWRIGAIRAATVVVAALAIPAIAAAQTRWSVGGAVGVAKFVDFDPSTATANGRSPRIAPWFEPTLGARLSRRASDRIDIDADVTFYPRYADRQTPGRGYHGFGKVAIAGGGRFTVLQGRGNFYVLARGGVIRFGRFPAILAVDGRGRATLVADSFAETFRAVDAGGGASWPVSKRWRFRIEAVDKLVRFHPKPASLNPVYTRAFLHVDAGLDLKF